jgi:uncharacterized surface protein with fasciclin (FAS1) repeats
MKALNLFWILSILFLLSSCDIADTNNETISDTAEGIEALKKGGKPAGDTILDIAGSIEDFSILAQAVQFAGLAEELDGRRQYTVFAPTNDAFVALLEALGLTAEELLSEENRELVTQVLLYHVAPGNRESGDVAESDQIRTLQKTFIKVKSEDGDFFVGNEENGFAKLITVDVKASNGVIHVIDTVMLPPSESNAADNGEGDENGEDEKPEESILDIAAGNEDFSILAEAVVFAGLAEELDGNRQYTVFAPTNNAFVNLLELLELTPGEFFVEENKGLIKDVLLYHVAPGNRAAEDVVTSDRIRTVGKSFIFVKEEDGGFFVGNEANGFAQIIATDIFARNGVIHVIDAVMLP